MARNANSRGEGGGGCDGDAAGYERHRAQGPRNRRRNAIWQPSANDERTKTVLELKTAGAAKPVH